jgi:regulation of enolase protein 1 (concanavalin A-like superfamily)
MKWELPFAPTCARLFAAARGAVGSAGKRSTVGFIVATLTLFAAATPLAAQTSGTWQAQDIGSVAAAGSSSQSGGTFTVSGSGADVWGTSDAFQFYAQTLTGDGSIVARVTCITNTSGWAKAGVMIRDSLAPNAANVFLAATPDWHGIVAQDRPTAGANTTNAQGPSVYPPYWLRLTRYSGAIFAETSPDGVNWMTFYTSNTALSPTAYIGLAVTSHNDGTLCTATFDNVSIVATPPSTGGLPSAPKNLSATALSSSEIALSWTNTASSQTGFSVERSATGSNFVEIFRSTTNGN